MTIGDALRKAIKDSGYSAVELGKKVELSQPTISRLLRGNDVKLSVAEKIAAELKFELTPMSVKATTPKKPTTKRSPKK